MSHVAVLSISEPVKIGPQKCQILHSDRLNRIVDALRVFAGEALAEPLECLTFAQAGEGGAGGLTYFGVRIPAAVLKRQQHLLTLQWLPPAQAADGVEADRRIPVSRGQQ